MVPASRYYVFISNSLVLRGNEVPLRNVRIWKMDFYKYFAVCGVSVKAGLFSVYSFLCISLWLRTQ